MVHLDEYEHLGQPDEQPALTAAQHRQQRESEQNKAIIRRMVRDAPPLSPGTIADVRRLLFAPVSNKELMRWRVRLYCGHIVERTAHFTHKTVDAAVSLACACRVCGLDPSTVVAAEPIGLVSEAKITASAAPAASNNRNERRRLDDKIRVVEEELAALRARMGSVPHEVDS